MARIDAFRQVTLDRPTEHDPTICEVSSYELGGKRFLQLNTTGRSSRENPGKISQSIQIDEAAAKMLLTLLHDAFPSLK